MQTQDFAKFVANQQDQNSVTANNGNIDWNYIRAEWLNNLDDLYQKILGFLQDFIVTGSIGYSFTNVTLNEENLGSYPAKKMNISIGRQHVVLEPIGTLIIGSKGRVDAFGSAGRAQLWLVGERVKSAADLIGGTITIGTKIASRSPTLASEEPISWAWKIVDRGVRTSFAEFDKESFFALLVEIAGA